MLNFAVDETRHTLTCSLSGRMDSEASAGVQSGIEERLAIETTEAFKLVFDMAQVGYMASAFLRICVMMAKKFPRDRFAIVNCTPFVRKTFTMAGLDQVIDIS